MAAKLRLVRPDEPVPPNPPRGRGLRLRYEQVLRDRDFAREMLVELQQKVRYLKSAGRDTDLHNELVQLRGDLQQACEERDCFENDAEQEHERAEHLEFDRALLLRHLGMSEQEFEIARERMELMVK